MTVITPVCREKFEAQMDQLAGKFDAVVDCTGSNFERYEKCLRPWGGSQYITFTRSGYQFNSILCWIFVKSRVGKMFLFTYTQPRIVQVGFDRVPPEPT